MTCRICLDDGELIQPCNCTGTTAHVHEECLLKWLVISNRRDCEICKFEYDIIEMEENVVCTANVFSVKLDVTAAVLSVGIVGHFLIIGITTAYWGTNTQTIFIYGNSLQIIMLFLLNPYIKKREAYLFWKICSLVCLLLSSIVTSDWDFFYGELLFTTILGIHLLTNANSYEKQTVHYINIVDRSTNDEAMQGP